MLINYFKLKNISRRGKTIALSVVGGVFILVSLLAIWQRNFADTLINYVPSDANLYIHFSRPKINSAEKIDQVLTQIFSEVGLADFNDLDIDREVAVIGHLQNDQIKYGLIFKTDRPTRVKKILTQAEIAYKPLAYNKFLITETDWLNNYPLNPKNQIKLNIAQRFQPLSSVNIYARSDFFDYQDDLNLNFIYSLLKNENNDLIISFKAKGQNLKMYNGGISSVVSRYSNFKTQSPKTAIAGDLVLASSDFYTILNNWQDNLKTLSPNNYQLFVASQLNTYLNTYLTTDSRHIFLVANYNHNNSGWLFGDYDFYLSLENIYASKVEEILKIIMASRYPVTKSVYLSDGTRVAELVPDIGQLAFLEQNGIKYLYSPDKQFKLMYKSEGSSIIISNNELLINQNWPTADFNYLKFGADFLSVSGFTKYLRFFEFLEVNSRGIILK